MIDKSLKRLVIGAFVIQAIVGYLLLHYGVSVLMNISHCAKVDTRWYIGRPLREMRCQSYLLSTERDAQPVETFLNRVLKMLATGKHRGDEV